jgi:predicted tellurium resistance membrane protein TerC
MGRFPVIVTLGAALIGWVGGETVVNDHLMQGYTMAHPWLHYVAAATGAVLVVGLGKFMQARAASRAQA